MEDLPWTTSDGPESDYYSLLLTSIVIEGAGSERGLSVDVERVGRLLEELANRGRITRRPTADDPAIALHIPGMRLRLYGSEKVAGGPSSSGPSPVMPRWCLSGCFGWRSGRRQGPPGSGSLISPTRSGHTSSSRRIGAPNGRGLWDEPTQAFAGTPFGLYGGPSWYQTERVVEALVAAANVTQSANIRRP